MILKSNFQEAGKHLKNQGYKFIVKSKSTEIIQKLELIQSECFKVNMMDIAGFLIEAYGKLMKKSDDSRQVLIQFRVKDLT